MYLGRMSLSLIDYNSCQLILEQGCMPSRGWYARHSPRQSSSYICIPICNRAVLSNECNFLSGKASAFEGGCLFRPCCPMMVTGSPIANEGGFMYVVLK